MQHSKDSALLSRTERRILHSNTAASAAVQNRRAVSSYFPEADEEEPEAEPQHAARRSLSPLQPRVLEMQPAALNPVHNQLSFPRSRAVLWDRQALSFPFFIRCRDACPALVLRRSIVADIARLMNSSQKHTKFLGRCMSLKTTPEHATLANSPLRLIESAYALVLEPLSSLEDASAAAGKANRLLVDVCSDTDNPHPDLRSMVNSVLHGMRRPGLFSLTSYLAIRATVQPAPGKAGVAVFEAVLPNIDLRLTRIHPIAFLGTSLASQLMGGPTRTGRTGYLTLNETRKVVPILETDPMLVSIPLVGVWVSDGAIDLGEDGATNLAHPTIWAACIRYLFCTEFKDKASVDDRTFLLVVVGSSGLRYYEVQGTLKTATSAMDDLDSSAALISLQRPPNTVSCVCLDFTVDLPVVEEHPQDLPASSIVARFRPQANVQRIGAFREVMEPLLRNSREDVPLYRVALPQHESPEPVIRPTFSSAAEDTERQRALKQDSKSSQPVSQSTEDGATPIPRAVQPQPSPTPPRADFVHSPRIDHFRTQEQDEDATTRSTPAAAPPMRTSIPGLDGSIPFAAAAIIASQQEQLLMMQMKLEELQKQLDAVQQAQAQGQRRRSPPKVAAKSYEATESQRASVAPEHVDIDSADSQMRPAAEEDGQEGEVVNVQEPNSHEDGSIEQQTADEAPDDMDPSDSVDVSMLDETFVTNIGGLDISSLHLPATSRSPRRASARSSTSPTPTRSSGSGSSTRSAPHPVVAASRHVSSPAASALPWAFEIPRIQMGTEHDASTFLESPTLANLEAKYLNEKSEVWQPKVPQPRQTNSPPRPSVATIVPDDERLPHSMIRQLPKL